MTSHELARRLLEGPDLTVTVRGYEGGVNEITTIESPKPLSLNKNDEWYYGRHEYVEDDPVVGDVLAIHIG